jgi:hypothetical protein
MTTKKRIPNKALAVIGGTLCAIAVLLFTAGILSLSFIGDQAPLAEKAVWRTAVMWVAAASAVIALIALVPLKLYERRRPF